MTRPNRLDVDFFVSRLKRRNPLTFVRYGDGEFSAILGKSGHNCDGHEYFPQMGLELATTLTQPRTGNFMYALGPKVRSTFGAEAEGWLQQWAPDVSWNDSEVFLHASLEGQLAPFVEEVSRHKVVLLGGSHLQPLTEAAGWRHVVTPDKNAWLWRAEARGLLAHARKDADVLLLCAGMLSKVMAYELHPLLGDRYTILDLGSLFDVYCCKDSRSYARRMVKEERQKLRRINFHSLPNFLERYAV